MEDLSRYADWIPWLTAAAEADPDLRYLAIGGSATTGGFDEWSDLDVDVVAAPDTASAVYRRMLEAARRDFDVRDVWEFSLADWPAGPHCFLNLQDRPGLLQEPTRIVDLHVSDRIQHTRVDVRRHGVPIVLHDPEGLLVLEDEDGSAALAQAVDQVRQRRTTGEWLVNRAIARGHVAEATSWYLRFPLDGVVRLLRVQHCPWRHDFELRYLREDLPADVADRIEALVPGSTAASLEDLSRRCHAWLDELLA